MMMRLGFRVAATVIVAAFLLGVLACLGQQFLGTAFLCRVPLATAAALALLAAAPYWPAPTMLGGLVRLNMPRLAVAAAATTLTTVSIVATSATALRYGEQRFGWPTWEVGLAGTSLQRWFWSPGLNAWQIVPAVVLLGSLVVHPPGTGRCGWQIGWRRGVVALGAALGTWLWAWWAIDGLHRALQRLSAASGWTRGVWPGWFGPGYLDPQSGLPAEGHLQSLALLLLAVVVYALGYVGLHPVRRQRWAVLHEWVPPIYYVLVLLTLGVWLLTGVTFFLDHWRVPSIAAIGLFSYLAYRWFLYDHYFTTTSFHGEPRRSEHTSDSDEDSATAVSGTEPQLPVAANFRYLSTNPASAESGETASILAPTAIDRDWTERRLSNLGPDDCLVVVTACGGGILAGAWLVRVLSELLHRLPRFERSLGLISAVSGGSVGTLFLIDRMLDQAQRPVVEQEHTAERWTAANAAVRASALEATMWGIAYPGLLRGVLPGLIWDRRYDHGWATECAWRGQMRRPDLSLGQVAQAYRDGLCPQVIFNAVCLENGRRFLFTSGVDQVADAVARELARVDFFSEYRGRDVPLVTAARMSATFPFISPIARVDWQPQRPALHLADGGYFDQSGVVSAVEWIRWQLEKPRSLLKARGVRRILVVRMSTPSSVVEVRGARVGWRNAVWGPLEALLNVRGTSQTERAERELDLFACYCRERHAVQFEQVEFALAGPGPLSWELSLADQAALDACWDRDYAEPLQTWLAGKPLDLARATHRTIEKLGTLLAPQS